MQSKPVLYLFYSDFNIFAPSVNVGLSTRPPTTFKYFAIETIHTKYNFALCGLLINSTKFYVCGTVLSKE